MHWYMDGDCGWWMWFGWLWMVIFWGVIIGVVVAVVRRSGPASPRSESDPLQILRRRYAAGEIDDEEFRRRRDELAR
jgi:putative membrane protein